jgi:hypothetical protein
MANGIVVPNKDGIMSEVTALLNAKIPQLVATVSATSTEQEVTLTAYSFYMVYATSAADSYTAAPSIYMICNNNGNPVAVHLGGTDYLTIQSKGSTSHKVGIKTSAPFGTQVKIWKVSTML